MRLRTRLALIVGFISLLGGFALGIWFAYGTRADATSNVERLINDALDIVRNDPQQDPASLLDFVKASPVPLSVHLFFDQLPAVEVVQGIDGDYPVEVEKLSVDQIADATSRFKTYNNVIPIHYKTLAVGSGEWVVVATSLRTIESQFSTTLRRSLFSSVLGALVVTFVISQLIRRELNSVDEITRDAQLIAAGNLDVALPRVGHRTEIGELSTALDQMVGSLRHAIEVTKESEGRMREFLGDASHELRTPLTVIRGYIDILNSGRELPTGQMERALRRLLSESQRMDSIISDMLLLAEMGEVRMEFDEQVNVSTIVRTFARDIMEQQPSRRVAKSIIDDLKVQGNSALLERLMSNITSNIRQHTSPTVPVAFALVRDGDNIVLTVDDGGPGLSDQMYARATEGFQRFDRNRSSSGGGFGLGLSIISSIVSAHHGTLELEPSELGGLRTRIVLPVARTDAAPAVRA